MHEIQTFGGVNGYKWKATRVALHGAQPMLGPHRLYWAKHISVSNVHSISRQNRSPFLGLNRVISNLFNTEGLSDIDIAPAANVRSSVEVLALAIAKIAGTLFVPSVRICSGTSALPQDLQQEAQSPASHGKYIL